MRRLRSLATWALLLPLFFAIASCRISNDARTTAARMADAANDLSDYYLALSHVVDDQAKLERLQHAMLGVPLDQQDLAQLKKIHLELAKRVVMAQSLTVLSKDFAELAGSEAPADVSSAAESLGVKLADIQQLPGASYAPDALQNAGKVLAQLALQHDERKIATQMDTTMTALSQMFSQERPACDSMNRTYIGLAQSLALELLKQNLVDPAGLLEPALKPFGLTSRMPAREIPQGLQDYAREQIHDQGEQKIAAQARASAALERALRELSVQFHELATQGRLSRGNNISPKLSDVELWTKQML
jgi:hypothetical protein